MFKRFGWLFWLLIWGVVPASLAQTAALTGYCNLGGVPAKTSGLSSTNNLQGVIPKCTVTVYLTGTQTLATIYADGSSTPLANPFTATTMGQWTFFSAVNVGYDVVLSGGVSPNIYPSPVTLTGLYPGFSFSGGGGFITSLTTTGTSGAAGVTSGVLNIPNYTYTLPNATTSVLGGVKPDGTSCTTAAGVLTCPGTGGSSVGAAGTIQAAGSTTGSFAASTPNNVNAALGFSAGGQFFGDSISTATGTSSTGPGNVAMLNGWNFLLRVQMGGPFINDSTPGYQVANQNWQYVWRDSNPQGAGVDPAYFSEILTNDAIQYGANTNKQLIAQRLLLSDLAFLSIPASNKVLGQSCTLAGGFAAQTSPLQVGMGVTSTTNGATATCSITTPKAADTLYACYDIADASVGTLTISVDGTPQIDELVGSGTTFNAFGDGGALIVTTGTSPIVASGVACARMTNGGAGWSAGSHSVKFTNTGTTGGTNTVVAEAVMAAPAVSATLNPTVISLTPNQQNTGSAGSPYVATYRGFLTTIVGELVADGLNDFIADTSDALLNDPRCGNGNATTMFATCYSDTVHPNNLGHLVMEQDVQASVPGRFLLGLQYSNPTQSIQNFTPSAPINPNHFMTANPFGLNGTATQYAPGYSLGCISGQCEYMFESSIGGFTSVSAGGFSWCEPKLYTAGLIPANPPVQATECPITLAQNGLFNVNTGLVINNDISGPQPLAVATSSTNQRSRAFSWNAGLWRTDASAAISAGPGFEAIPVSPTPAGQNPTVYLTFGNYLGQTFNFALDLRASNLPNLLGNVVDTSWIINGSQTITALQGTTGTKLAAATGTFTNGNLRSTNSTGDEVDSGIAASNVPLLNASNVFTGTTNTFGTFSVGTVGLGSTGFSAQAGQVATSSTNYNSPLYGNTGNYWNGTASAQDSWFTTFILGSGANPTSTLTFTHSGSSGAASVSLPALKTSAYTVGTLPSASSLPAGTQVTVSDDSGLPTSNTCTGSGTEYAIAITNGTTWTCH